jgi:Protein of unknown function (DUF3307)
MFEALFIMLLLQIKHYYADFVIQTYAQTVRKGIYRDPVGISHTLDHIIGSLVVLFLASLFIPMSLPLMVILCFVEGVIHYHIDWTKVHFGCKDNTKPLFWNQFGLDQLAHQVTYLAMIPLLIA